MRRLLAVPIVLFLLVGGLVTAPEEVDAVVPGDVGMTLEKAFRQNPLAIPEDGVTLLVTPGSTLKSTAAQLAERLKSLS